MKRRGLYNPFTLGGDIVVNDVLASVHSDWFLDAAVPNAWAHHLPAVYQVCDIALSHDASSHRHSPRSWPVDVALVLAVSPQQLVEQRSIHETKSTPADQNWLAVQAVMAPARLLYRIFGPQAVRHMDAAVGGFATIAGGSRGSLAGFVKAQVLMLRGQFDIHTGAI